MAEVQLDHLQESGEVGHAQNLLRLIPAHERQHLAVLGSQQLERPAAESTVALAQRDEAFHPRQRRVRVRRLRLDVDRLVVVLGVGDHRQVESLAVAV